MTKRELNRDIKRLRNNIAKALLKENGADEYFKYIDGEAKREFTRLYYADPTMQSMSKQSIIMMLGLNVSHRFIAMHHFTPSKY